MKKYFGLQYVCCAMFISLISTDDRLKQRGCCWWREYLILKFDRHNEHVTVCYNGCIIEYEKHLELWTLFSKMSYIFYWLINCYILPYFLLTFLCNFCLLICKYWSKTLQQKTEIYPEPIWMYCVSKHFYM